MTGARTCFVFGEVSGTGAGWTKGAVGLVPGTMVVALCADVAGLGVAGGFAGVLVG